MRQTFVVKASLSVVLVLLSVLPELSYGASQVVESDEVFIPGGEMVPLYANPEKKRKARSRQNQAAPPVKVPPFYISRYPVTREEFLNFLRAEPRWQRRKVPRIFADVGYLRDWSSDLEFTGSGRQPVTEVSWFAAKSFCKSRGARLPSTIEWEYVARASETKADGQGDEAYLSRILSWYGRRDPELPEIGTWKNFYGVSDMHGVIWEWVSDFNSALITGESRGDAQAERNLFCGGGALFASEKQKRDYAAFMRFAFRSSLEGTYSLPQLGFRCAKDANQKRARQ